MVDNVAEIVTGVTATLLGGAFALRKLQGQWVKEGSDMEGARANSKVIELMREEIERLAKVNAELAAQANKFQMENIQLTAKMVTLTQQMNELQYENAKLGTEVIELKEAIKEFKEMFRKCDTCPSGFMQREE